MSGGTFDANGQNPPLWQKSSLPTIGGSGTITNSSAVASTIPFSSQNGNKTFSGNIVDGAGTVGLNLYDANNTWTLSGNNTYTGGTTINNGTLVADHNSALGTGTTTINGGTLEIAATRTITKAITLTSGTLVVNGAINTGALTLTAGTIKGSGTIGQAMTIGSGLTLSPGGSIGLLGTGNLTISGTLDNELGCSGITPVSDLVNVTGTVTLNSGANLKLTLGSGLSNPAIDDIFYLVSNDLADAVTGVFTKLNGTATTLDEGSQFTWNTQQWKITYTANASSGFTGGNDIALKVMPEPATLALLGLGGLGLILGRKRR
jgi:autotransporter-associated beta strand protein